MTEVVLDNMNEAMLIFDDSKNLVFSNPASKLLFASSVRHTNNEDEEEE